MRRAPPAYLNPRESGGWEECLRGCFTCFPSTSYLLRRFSLYWLLEFCVLVNGPCCVWIRCWWKRTWRDSCSRGGRYRCFYSPLMAMSLLRRCSSHETVIQSSFYGMEHFKKKHLHYLTGHWKDIITCLIFTIREIGMVKYSQWTAVNNYNDYN